MASIDDINSNEIVVFPNPSTGIFNILEESVQVDVLDLNGKVIYKNIATNSIDFSGYSGGVYLAKILIEGRIHIIKLSKQ